MSLYDKTYSLMEEIWNNFSIEDKEWFVGEVPHAMHHTLGRHLRNHAGLWEHSWEPELVDGVDYSEEHPDFISMKVIIDFQNKMSTVHGQWTE